MRSRCLAVVAGLVLVSATLVAVGCSQDTTSSGSQDISMTYTPSPSGSGRFDSASFKINTIKALPADPVEAALFGTDRITFRFTPFQANLVLVTPVPYSHFSLSAGTYIVTEIEFTPPALVDTALAPPPYAACVDGVATIDAQSGTGVPATFNFVTPTTDLSGFTFTVVPGQTSLALTVNVPALIQGYQASFGCQYVPCTGCPVDPKPTLTAFNTATFSAVLLANITIK
jgi:hypothetical protein